MRKKRARMKAQFVVAKVRESKWKSTELGIINKPNSALYPNDLLVISLYDFLPFPFFFKKKTIFLLISSQLHDYFPLHDSLYYFIIPTKYFPLYFFISQYFFSHFSWEQEIKFLKLTQEVNIKSREIFLAKYCPN